MTFARDILPPFAWAGIPPVSTTEGPYWDRGFSWERERIIAALSCIYGPPSERLGFSVRDIRRIREKVFEVPPAVIYLLESRLRLETVESIRRTTQETLGEAS